MAYLSTSEIPPSAPDQAANEYADGPPNLDEIAAILSADRYSDRLRAALPGERPDDRSLVVVRDPEHAYGVRVFNDDLFDQPEGAVANEAALRHVIDKCGLKPLRPRYGPNARPIKRTAPLTAPVIAPSESIPDATFPIIDPTIWEGAPVPARDWLVDGVIPSRTVTLLSGDGGVGKSLLALQIAVAMALGRPTAGLEVKPGRALYLAAEDEADELHRRVWDITRASGGRLSDLGNLRIVPMADRDALLSIPDTKGVMQPTANWLWFAVHARAFRPKLIVLDTSADLFGGDEIKRAQVRGFVAMARKLAMEIDAAILLLSHPSVAGIASGTGISGSTAWNNSVRSRLYMTPAKSVDGAKPDPDARRLELMKANHGQPGREFRLRWVEGVFVAEDDLPPAVANAGAIEVDELFVALLSKLNRQGQRLGTARAVNFAPSVMARHADAKGVSKRQLELAMDRLLETDIIQITSEGPPSRSRQRLLVSAECFGPR